MDANTVIAVLFVLWVVGCFVFDTARDPISDHRLPQKNRGIGERIWSVVAKVLSYKPIADALIRRARKRPYSHLPMNSNPSYMERYWLFNAYDDVTNEMEFAWFPWSLRLHLLKRGDYGEHLHDHPRKSRTILLKGGYCERRMNPAFVLGKSADQFIRYYREKGDTASLEYGEFHHIEYVSKVGTWSLFIVGRYLGPWGFMVNGVKVASRRYFQMMHKGV